MNDGLAHGRYFFMDVARDGTHGAPPSSSLMLAFGGAAFAANLACVAMLWRFRGANVNMSSTFECSRNDVLSNIGVLVAAGLVSATQAGWPDIVVGAAIALILFRSAWRVLVAVLPAWRDAAAAPGMLR